MHSRYSATQLQSMARTVMHAEKIGDPRAATFLIRLARAVGLPLPACRGLVVRIAS